MDNIYSIIKINNNSTISGKSFDNIFDALKYLSKFLKKKEKGKAARVFFYKLDQPAIYYPNKYATVARAYETNTEYVNYCEDISSKQAHILFEKCKDIWDEFYLIDLTTGNIIERK